MNDNKNKPTDVEPVSSDIEEPDEAEGEPEEDDAVFDGMKVAKECYDWVEIFVITITAVLMVFTFLLRPAYVVGPSMENTLHEDDALIVSNLFYTPKQGDIVVFQSPDSVQVGDEAVVKRVIATEGQTVDIDFETWTVTVDGEVLDEPYVNYLEGMYMRSYDLEFPITVPDGCVFLMGDNRNHSLDSRSSDIGCVDTRFIFGRVLFRALPFNKFGAVD
ncbi:MAG: signal peptidase I [Clostridia bacterium]|nr:signal peptidase I [Clostridia bacterium]